MKTLHELKLEHANTPYGDLPDFIYAYFVDYCHKMNLEYRQLYSDYSKHDEQIRKQRLWIDAAMQRMDADDFDYIHKQMNS